MISSSVIAPNPPQETALNYAHLREEGISHLEKLAPELWTDFNAHDPGVTLLEVICYALTDLGYRASLPIEDLLAPSPDQDSPPKEDPETTRVLEKQHALFSASEILTTAPVTEIDLRKIIVDRVPEVINIWVNPYVHTHFVSCFKGEQSLSNIIEPGPQGQYGLKGLWEFTLDLEPGLNKTETKAVLNRVHALYHSNRNLGEDLGGMKVVDTQGVMICADINLTPEADIDRVAAQLIHRVTQYLSPPIPRYSIEQLRTISKNEKINMDELYSGPIVQNGFILDEDIASAVLPAEVCAGEIVSLIMDIPGVQAVRDLSLNYSDPLDQTGAGESLRCLPIRPGQKPVLDIAQSVLHFFKDYLPFTEDQDRVDKYLQELRDTENQIEVVSGDRPITFGKYRAIDGHLSLQQDLPLAYGVAPHGLAPTASDERRTMARQLQGFLMLFDQILANYLGQLSEIKSLFSVDPEFRETYFSDAVSGFGDICSLVQDPNGDHQLCRDSELTSERDDARTRVQQSYEDQMRNLLRDVERDTKRRNQFLDHLLSRFGERFTDYVLLTQQLFHDDEGDKAIRSKATFLREYPYLSRRRGCGHNLYQKNKQWDTENVSGVGHRVSRLLGFPSIKRRNLASVYALLFEQLDEDNENDLRFRLRQTETGRVLLSSSTRYDTREEAAEEMAIAVDLAQDLANYELLQDQLGRFYFNIIDSEGEVVARRIQYFDTEQQRLSAMQELQQELDNRFSQEGIFIVENLLLRPRKPNDGFLPICTNPQCDGLEEPDPYSWHVQIIVPAYGARLGDTRFRQFVERTLRRELPVHLMPRICFVDADQMGLFEEAWRKWLEYRSKRPHTELAANRSLNHLLKVLNGLHSVYPVGTLHDCVEDGDEESTIVLNQSRLGSSSSPAGEPPRPNDGDTL